MAYGIFNITKQAIRYAKESLDTVGANISRSQVPSARSIDSVATTLTSGGEVLGISTSYIRKEDQILSATLRNSASSASTATVIQDVLSSLNKFLTAPTDTGNDAMTSTNGAQSTLIVAINRFFGRAKAMSNSNDISLKQVFVAEGVKLANAFSDATNKVLDLRLQADKDLSNSLNEVNTLIQGLFDINQSLSAGSASPIILDERDRLLSELSQQFSIRVAFGSNGSALVKSAAEGLTLVDQTIYSSFTYQGVSSTNDLVTGKTIPAVVMQQFNKAGKELMSIDAISSSDGSSKPQISGGKVEGYISLRDDILVNSGKIIASLTNSVADAVNSIHNDGSPYPPHSTLTSTKQVAFSDYTSWSGKLQIAAVDNAGAQTDIRPVIIDLEKLTNSTRGEGSPTTLDLINEINSMFDAAPQRLRIGSIKGSDGNDIESNDKLLNNIKLVGSSNIAADGKFAFDLELDGNEYFGSKVEILGVRYGNPEGPYTALANDELPEQYSLAKGVHQRTNQKINVPLAPGVAQNIQLKIRVIGENGVVEDGTAVFAIHPNDGDMLNRRVTGTLPLAIAPDNKMTLDANNETNGAIIFAKLVDSSGVAIDTTDNTTQGSIVLATRNAVAGHTLGIVMAELDSEDLGNANNGEAGAATGRGFSHYFGFNDFFVTNAIDGTITVREDIANDTSMLSIGQISTHYQAEVNVGDVAAKATMQFNGNPNNTGYAIIDGTQFTFVNALTGAQNEVLIDDAGDLNNTLTRLTAAINNNTILQSKISATLVGDTITITAVQAGISGNDIGVRVNMAAGNGNTVSINNAVAGILKNGTLQGGTDKTKSVEMSRPLIANSSSQVLSAFDSLSLENVKISDSGLIPSYDTTLHNYAINVTGFIANQAIEANTNQKITEQVVRDLQTKLLQDTGIDINKQYFDMLEYGQYLSANFATIRLYNKIMDDFFSLFR